MDIDKISNLIKSKRKENNLTQEELACRIGVTEKAISRWETGRGTPDISLLIPLSKELGIDVSELLSGKVNKKDIESILIYNYKNKKLKSKIPLIVSIILYVFFLLGYLLYLRVSYDGNKYIQLNYFGHLFINVFFCLLIIISNWNLYTNYYDKIIDKNNMKKITYSIILIIYMIMILNLTIFLRPIKIFNIKGFMMIFKYGGINIIPFKTILEYVFQYERFTSYQLFINIIGNVVIFIPVMYLMIKIFGMLNLKKYLLIDIIMLLVIEFIQLITNCGVFDIDDIILNLMGMLFVYFIAYKKSE